MNLPFDFWARLCRLKLVTPSDAIIGSRSLQLLLVVWMTARITFARNVKLKFIQPDLSTTESCS
jgi:hypothetical protein